jgi:subtilisin family serine protease
MLKGTTLVKGNVRVAAKKHREYVPGQIILRIRPAAATHDVVGSGFDGARLAFTGKGARAAPEAVSAPLEYLRRNAGLKSVAPVFSQRRDHLLRAPVSPGERARLAMMSSVIDSTSERLRGITVVELDPKKVTSGLMKHLRASDAIEIAEPMPARWLQAASMVDPLQNRQWGLRAIRWFEAKRQTTGQVKVAVLDTGVDRHHPDLRSAVDTYSHQGLSPRDLIGHGTHVSGIIAATVNNHEGISGVVRCKLMVWKIFGDKPDSDGEFYVDGERYLRALGEVRTSGAKVLNLSIGGTASSQAEQLLFRTLEEAGVVVVAAMGNEYQDGNPREYPAAYDRVLAVGAIAENMKRSVFSNTGTHIGLVAPGSNILSTLPTKGSPYLQETDYAAWSGTSMATPHAAGAAAAVFAKKPAWTPAQVKRRLTSAARPLSGMGKKRRTSTYGNGLLDLQAALP